jgi:hypothetical protein
MATNVYSAQIGLVNARGDVNIIYPKTLATNVSYTNADMTGVTTVGGALDWLNSNSGGGVGSVVTISTSTEWFIGRTVTVTGTYESYTGTFDLNSECKVNVQYIDTYEIECEGYTTTINVAAIGMVYNVTLNESYTTVNISTPNSNYYGESINIKFVFFLYAKQAADKVRS